MSFCKLKQTIMALATNFGTCNEICSNLEKVSESYVSLFCKLQNGTRWSDYIFNLAWSCFCVDPTEISEISVDREVFRLSNLLRPAAPRHLPKEKRVWK